MKFRQFNNQFQSCLLHVYKMMIICCEIGNKISDSLRSWDEPTNQNYHWCVHVRNTTTFKPITLHTHYIMYVSMSCYEFVCITVYSVCFVAHLTFICMPHCLHDILSVLIMYFRIHTLATHNKFRCHRLHIRHASVLITHST